MKFLFLNYKKQNKVIKQQRHSGSKFIDPEFGQRIDAIISKQKTHIKNSKIT